MQKPKRLITVIFELDEKSFITGIHAPGTDTELLRELIKCARRDIKSGYLLNDNPAQVLPPYKKIMQDVNYILAGGNLQNLPSEDL